MISLTFRSFSLVCLLLAVCRTVDCKHDPKWIKPGALDRWGQQQQQQQKERSRENPSSDASCEAEPTVCDCPPVPEPAPPLPCSSDVTEDQRLSLVFYRKLVRTLFARDTLVVDPAAEDFLTTGLAIRISTRQLEKLLDESTSARELNLMVSAILEQSDNTRQWVAFRENQCERLYDFLMQLFESQFLQYILPVLLMIAGCYAIRVIARITHLHPFIVFLLLSLSITVCKKWKECNENLARKTLESMEAPPTTRWTSIFGTLRSRQDGATPLPICDPLQVLVQSTVSIQADFFKSMFSEFYGAYTEYTKDAGWLERSMIGLLMLGFAYILITALVNVGISSGFQMFGTIVTSTLRSSGPANNNGQQQQQQQQLPTVNLNFHISEGAARSISVAEMLRQESQQRIEVVSEEVAAPVQAIEEATTVEANCSEATTKEATKKSEEVPTENANDVK
ncbi:AGAP013236-PA [Anopheles gambiae str. PEST]|uniref:AGAP013236-PA n=1 Tax=Anopheles gambiae TaxID=7165 RepID=F5HML4_ANOGA|nr:AGAP013236-PA [Anopheles gambiae str. PEST]